MGIIRSVCLNTFTVSICTYVLETERFIGMIILLSLIYTRSFSFKETILSIYNFRFDNQLPLVLRDRIIFQSVNYLTVGDKLLTGDQSLSSLIKISTQIDFPMRYVMEVILYALKALHVSY